MTTATTKSDEVWLEDITPRFESEDEEDWDIALRWMDEAWNTGSTTIAAVRDPQSLANIVNPFSLFVASFSDPNKLDATFPLFLRLCNDLFSMIESCDAMITVLHQQHNQWHVLKPHLRFASKKFLGYLADDIIHTCWNQNKKEYYNLCVILVEVGGMEERSELVQNLFAEKTFDPCKRRHIVPIMEHLSTSPSLNQDLVLNWVSKSPKNTSFTATFLEALKRLPTKDLDVCLSYLSDWMCLASKSSLPAIFEMLGKLLPSASSSLLTPITLSRTLVSTFTAFSTKTVSSTASKVAVRIQALLQQKPAMSFVEADDETKNGTGETLEFRDIGAAIIRLCVFSNNFRAEAALNQLQNLQQRIHSVSAAYRKKLKEIQGESMFSEKKRNDLRAKAFANKNDHDDMVLIYAVLFCIKSMSFSELTLVKFLFHALVDCAASTTAAVVSHRMLMQLFDSSCTHRPFLIYLIHSLSDNHLEFRASLYDMVVKTTYEKLASRSKLEQIAIAHSLHKLSFSPHRPPLQVMLPAAHMLLKCMEPTLQAFGIRIIAQLCRVEDLNVTSTISALEPWLAERDSEDVIAAAHCYLLGGVSHNCDEKLDNFFLTSSDVKDLQSLLTVDDSVLGEDANARRRRFHALSFLWEKTHSRSLCVRKAAYANLKRFHPAICVPLIDTIKVIKDDEEEILRVHTFYPLSKQHINQFLNEKEAVEEVRDLLQRCAMIEASLIPRSVTTKWRAGAEAIPSFSANTLLCTTSLMAPSPGRKKGTSVISGEDLHYSLLRVMESDTRSTVRHSCLFTLMASDYSSYLCGDWAKLLDFVSSCLNGVRYNSICTGTDVDFVACIGAWNTVCMSISACADGAVCQETPEDILQSLCECIQQLFSSSTSTAEQHQMTNVVFLFLSLLKIGVLPQNIKAMFIYNLFLPLLSSSSSNAFAIPRNPEKDANVETGRISIIIRDIATTILAKQDKALCEYICLLFVPVLEREEVSFTVDAKAQFSSKEGLLCAYVWKAMWFVEEKHTANKKKKKIRSEGKEEKCENGLSTIESLNVSRKLCVDDIVRTFSDVASLNSVEVFRCVSLLLDMTSSIPQRDELMSIFKDTLLSDGNIENTSVLAILLDAMELVSPRKQTSADEISSLWESASSCAETCKLALATGLTNSVSLIVGFANMMPLKDAVMQFASHMVDISVGVLDLQDMVSSNAWKQLPQIIQFYLSGAKLTALQETSEKKVAIPLLLQALLANHTVMDLSSIISSAYSALPPS
eukprot:m.56544 g.56544  ORF g.56544 m.56544 type:complete len:1256 (-) comp7803_c0_seq2:41-3808(-)